MSEELKDDDICMHAEWCTLHNQLAAGGSQEGIAPCLLD